MMPDQSFDLVLLVVYFAYGLAFFGMGLTLALESERSPALAEVQSPTPAGCLWHDPWSS